MTEELGQNSSETTASDEEFYELCEAIASKYGQLLESMPDGVIIADEDGRIVLVNTQVEKLFGYDHEELISQEVEILVPERHRSYHVGLRNGYIAQPEVRAMGQDVLSGLRRDGSEFAVEICLSPMNTDLGTLVCAAVRDVTRRVGVETALRTSEDQVRHLLDSTAEAIYGLDLEGNCTFSNRACVEILGYKDTEDLLGKNMHDLIHHTRSDGTSYPMHECKIYEAFRRGKGTHVDDEVLWKADGSSFPAEYRSFPVQRDGKLVGSVVTFLDISEQKRVAEAIRVQQTELTRAARLSTLGEMAAGLAHELNQPLTAMSAFAEGALARLERGKLQEHETVSVFSRISEDAQRAGEIIRRLRNFVQNRQAQRVQIDLNHLVRDVYKFVESDAHQEDIVIQFELQDGLPEVEADPIEIQQVLLNLIRNASDALGNSAFSERRIVISTYESNPGRVEIVVKDSGPGISNNMADQVFEPFFTSKSDGMGIGLGICQNIVESHGGRIWIGNTSIGGASVHFDLPLSLQEEKADAS